MMKKGIACLLAAWLVLLSIPAGLADMIYSFPEAGVRLTTQADWTVITPDSVEEHVTMLRQLGADPDALRADYAANHTVFEIYMPEGIQVTLNAVRTEETEAWGSTAYMDEAALAAFVEAYTRAPYEDTQWAEDAPGHLRCAWSLQAGGLPVHFAGLITVRQGMLYTLTAMSATRAADALHAANVAVWDDLEYLGADITASEAAASIAAPTPVMDDGITTPLALEDFSGVSYEDSTVIYLRTLPGAELMLYTATDSLRARANEEGLHKYTLSTKRQTVYSYRVTAQAEGRTISEIQISIDRQLTAEALELAYRRSAKPLENIGYSNIARAPEQYAGESITFRGPVGAEYAELGGYPCVLVYTRNPGRGVWSDPIWVMLTEAVSLEEDTMCTVYGDLRGDTMAYTDAEGAQQQAPVLVSRSIQF